MKVIMSWFVMVDTNVADPKKAIGYFVRDGSKHKSVSEKDPQNCKLGIHRKDSDLQQPNSDVTLEFILVAPDAVVVDIRLADKSPGALDPDGWKNFPIRPKIGGCFSLQNVLFSEGTWKVQIDIKKKGSRVIYTVDPEITNEDVRT